MVEKYFKNFSEKVAIPFIKICIFLKIKPNMLSVAGLIVIVIGSYYFLILNVVHLTGMQIFVIYLIIVP